MFSKRTIAVIISRICGPESIIPVAIWLLTNTVLTPVEDRLMVLVVTGVFFVALPILTFGAFFYFGKLSDIDVTNRRERPLVLLIKQLWWTVGLVWLGVSWHMELLFWVYAWWYVIGLTALGVSLVWKISLHTLGITTLGIVAWHMLPQGYVWYFPLVLVAVAWSRWYLKKHTVGQLVAGAIVPLVWWGVALTLMAK